MSKYEGERKFQAEEWQMVHLFVEHCKKYGTTKKRTYNLADPTHQEKTKVQFLMHDQTDPEIWNKLDVEVDDVTWFTNIEFSEDGKSLAKGMWNPAERCFINVSLNGEAFFDLLSSVLFYSEHQSDYDREDELSAMGYYEE